MKSMDRRLSKIQLLLAQRNGSAGVPKQSPADILRNRYRRRMEASGETNAEPPPIRPVDGHGRPLSVAEILRLRFRRLESRPEGRGLEVASR